MKDCDHAWYTVAAGVNGRVERCRKCGRMRQVQVPLCVLERAMPGYSETPEPTALPMMPYTGGCYHANAEQARWAHELMPDVYLPLPQVTGGSD